MRRRAIPVGVHRHRPLGDDVGEADGRASGDDATVDRRRDEHEAGAIELAPRHRRLP
jgi:hypothetical protein